MIRALIITSVVFAAGIAIGHIGSPYYESRAIEGCETVATGVHNMLMECEWQESNCKISLLEQVERNDNILKTLGRNIR